MEERITKQIGHKGKYYALNALRVIAVMLVFNSHCGALYPVSALATGGAMGNALFFVISGYLLKTSGDFLPWIGKKIVRLYPATLLVSLVYTIVFRSFPGSIWQFVWDFIWPNSYWFIGAFLFFNILIYIMDRLNVFEYFKLYSILMLIVYFALYILFVDKTRWSVEDKTFFRWVYYFYIYSLGYALKKGCVRMSNTGKLTLFLIAVISFVGSIAVKFVMVKVPVIMNFQFICQMLGIVFAYAALCFSMKAEEQYIRLPEKMIGTVDYFSARSLEIYLAQRTFQHLSEPLPFPLGVINALVMTLIYAHILHMISSFIVKKTTKSKH